MYFKEEDKIFKQEKEKEKNYGTEITDFRKI